MTGLEPRADRVSKSATRVPARSSTVLAHRSPDWSSTRGDEILPGRMDAWNIKPHRRVGPEPCGGREIDGDQPRPRPRPSRSSTSTFVAK